MAGPPPTTLALAAGEGPLADALCKNIFNGQQPEQARRLAAYVQQAVTALAGLNEATLSARAGGFRRPAPSAWLVRTEWIR